MHKENCVEPEVFCRSQTIKAYFRNDYLSQRVRLTFAKAACHVCKMLPIKKIRVRVRVREQNGESLEVAWGQKYPTPTSLYSHYQRISRIRSRFRLFLTEPAFLLLIFFTFSVFCEMMTSAAILFDIFVGHTLLPTNLFTFGAFSSKPQLYVHIHVGLLSNKLLVSCNYTLCICIKYLASCWQVH